MQNLFDLKLFTFNLSNHSDIDIILDERNIILLFYYKNRNDFHANFYKITKATLKFQNIHVIFEDSHNLR